MKKQIQKYCLNGQTKKGFLLIEGLTVLFIFALVTVTFYSVFSIGIRYIQDAKNRLGALAIANEKIEIIRNLQYDSIGTDEGAIEGDIPQDQDVLENTRQYHIHTDVSYVDDPYDGLAYSDTAWFEDYKRVTVTISWVNGGGTEEVKLVSRFVPPGKEVPHIGDGILSINIFSDQPGGVGIPGSRVDIYNPDTEIDTYGITDSTGNVTFMGSRVSNSIQKYQLTVTKNGYETVHTMSP
ncbi:MAG: carboxypeptidase-like regulatory domain-containing protein, partial [Candidatus Moraniibacteriota bacterium]